MRLIRNYALLNWPLLSLKAILAKTQSYMFFFIFLSKNDEKHRSKAFYQRVTLLRDGFPTVYY